MGSAEENKLKAYYASLSDQALDEAYCLGPEGYRDSRIWEIVEGEYSSRGLITEAVATGGSSFETYYDLLGIPKNATEREVKVGYRTQALRWHPDRNNGSKESEERFKQIAQGYEVLSDPQNRRTYDESLAIGGLGSPFGRSVDSQPAANLFMQEMADLAAELAFRNMSPEEIQAELRVRGCPPLVAARFGRKFTSWRENVVRQSVWSSFQFKFVIIPGVPVLLLTLIWGSPDVYRLLIYLAIAGGPLIYYLITGRAPSR